MKLGLKNPFVDVLSTDKYFNREKCRKLIKFIHLIYAIKGLNFKFFIIYTN